MGSAKQFVKDFLIFCLEEFLPGKFLLLHRKLAKKSLVLYFLTLWVVPIAALLIILEICIRTIIITFMAGAGILSGPYIYGTPDTSISEKSENKDKIESMS